MAEHPGSCPSLLPSVLLPVSEASFQSTKKRMWQNPWMQARATHHLHTQTHSHRCRARGACECAGKSTCCSVQLFMLKPPEYLAALKWFPSERCILEIQSTRTLRSSKSLQLRSSSSDISGRPVRWVWSQSQQTSGLEHAKRPCSVVALNWQDMFSCYAAPKKVSSRSFPSNMSHACRKSVGNNSDRVGKETTPRNFMKFLGQHPPSPKQIC